MIVLTNDIYVYFLRASLRFKYPAERMRRLDSELYNLKNESAGEKLFRAENIFHFVRVQNLKINRWI